MGVRVAVSGLGRLGGELILRVQESRSAELVALVSHRAAQLRSDPPAAVAAGARLLDFEQALADEEVEVIIDGHHGSTDEIAELFRRCAERGKSVVSSSALFDPVSEIGAEAANALDLLARRTGARLLGTGLNPGFVLDMLPAIWGALSPGWTRVTAIRTVEAGGWGPGPSGYLGIGGEPAALEAIVPMPLTPSLIVLAAALDVVPDEMGERRRALVASEDVALGDDVLARGAAIGFHHRASAAVDGGRTLEVVWHAAVGLARYEPGSVNGVTVEVDGDMPMRMSATGAFAEDPYPATAARMVQSAVAMQAVRAGLLRPDEVPFGWAAESVPTPTRVADCCAGDDNHDHDKDTPR
jgi:2,4-diaminopentanoate dehydrogenase